jgi:UDPglucose 6-dehydrogenase
MKIAVIGAGYVGLTTAACLAQIGHHVFCSESDESKLEKLKGVSCRCSNPISTALLPRINDRVISRLGPQQMPFPTEL